ncbi:MAG: catalase [Bacteroidota bacterium]
MGNLELGKEYIPADEHKHIEEMLDMMVPFLEEKYPPGETLRHFHPKMHGCLKAQFIVEDLEDKYKVGLFKTAKTYDAWVRFSNAPPNKQADKRASGRGFAIKILDVAGDIIDDDPIGVKTQNFLMTTSPVLSPGHVANYRRAIKALVNGFPGNLPYILDPGNWRRLRLTLKFMKKHANLLEVPYFTGAPIAFGEDKAVKFSIEPQKSATSKMPRKPTDYFLRERLMADLVKGDVLFDFMIQEQQDPNKELVEDTSCIWKTPFKKIATVKLLQQEFTNQERIIFGENLFFSPWQCLEEHRPLGGINRARREVYRVLSDFRKQRNGVG